jgi:hypothetical protein
VLYFYMLFICLNILAVPCTQQDAKIAQLNRTAKQMQNEIIWLRGNDELRPGKKNHNIGISTHGFRYQTEKNKNMDDDHIPKPRPPWNPNPNAVMMEKCYDDSLEEFDEFMDHQDTSNDASPWVSESMEMDNDTFPFAKGELEE